MGFQQTAFLEPSTVFYPSIKFAELVKEYDSDSVWGYLSVIIILSILMVSGLAKLCYDRVRKVKELESTDEPNNTNEA
jgi:hypothetical protein